MKRLDEAQGKIGALREYIRKLGISGVLICQQPNFSWITAGGRGYLGLASTAACAMLLVTADNVFLMANVIEGKRLMREEMPQGLCELKTLPWQDDGELRALAQRLTGGKLADDAQLADYFKARRLILCQAERERYRDLGREAAMAMETALLETKAGDAEFTIAGRISAALWAIGAEPISLFVAADDRSQRCRHFIPTAYRAKEKVIASICARRHGLVISATRSISLGEIDGQWQTDYRKLTQVETAMFRAIRSGDALKECFLAAIAAYETLGLQGEENNHHQGGLTGYLPREIRMDANSDILMAAGQAFAFNPSCPGAKAEDTFVLTEDGLENLSDSGRWPMEDVEGVMRPCIAVIRKEAYK